MFDEVEEFKKICLNEEELNTVITIELPGSYIWVMIQYLNRYAEIIHLDLKEPDTDKALIEEITNRLILEVIKNQERRGILP